MTVSIWTVHTVECPASPPTSSPYLPLPFLITPLIVTLLLGGPHD